MNNFALLSSLTWSMLVGLGCASTPAPSDAPGIDNGPSTATTTTARGTKIHALRTGFVRVKQAHRELDGPAGLRFPAVIGDRQWADWMPIIVYVIEHDHGVIVVDTGPSPRINDDGYWGCDPRSQWFYQRNLRFELPPNETLARRLDELGVSPAQVTDVVISHFHGDHIGGIELFPEATVHVGPGNWPEHTGSVTCVLPPWFQPTLARYEDRPVGVFDQSMPLTPDGSVSMVPLPGHTPGHAGVVVEDGERRWLIAGDATFDRDQTERGAVCGVSQDVEDARATQAKLLAQLSDPTTVLLPAHDPSVFARL